MEQDLGLLLDASTTETTDSTVTTDPVVDQTLPETADMTVEQTGGSTSEETTDQSVDVSSLDASIAAGGSEGGISAGQVGGDVGGVSGGVLGGVTAGEEVVDEPANRCTEENPEDCVCQEPIEGDMCTEEPETTSETQTEVKKAENEDSCDQISITSPVLMVALFAAVLFRKFAIFSR